MNLIDDVDAQVNAVRDWFDELADAHRLLPSALSNEEEETTLA